MTYWTYAVNKKFSERNAAVAAADIRVTYSDGEGKIKGFSENESVIKIIPICAKNGDPFPWGSAIILVMGTPFWDTSTGEKSKNGIKNIVKRVGDEFSQTKYKNVVLSAESLGIYLKQMQFSGSCLLGIIFSNKKQISSCNLDVRLSHGVQNNTLFSAFLVEDGGFEYQESTRGSFFANKELEPLIFRPADITFTERAPMVLENIIRQYSGSKSDDNLVRGSGFYHSNTVAATPDIAVMSQEGKITIKKAPRQEGQFMPNQHNSFPAPNTVFGAPSHLVGGEEEAWIHGGGTDLDPTLADRLQQLSSEDSFDEDEEQPLPPQEERKFQPQLKQHQARVRENNSQPINLSRPRSQHSSSDNGSCCQQ